MISPNYAVTRIWTQIRK